MSLGGLHKFVHGATPRAKNLRLLVRWFFAEDDEPEELTVAEARHLAWVLVGDVATDEVTAQVARTLGAITASIYAAHGAAPPRWTGELAGATCETREGA